MRDRQLVSSLPVASAAIFVGFVALAWYTAEDCFQEDRWNHEVNIDGPGMEKYLEIQDEERIIDDAHSPRSITGQTQQGQDGDDAGSPQSVPGKKRVRTDDDSEDEAGEDVDAPGETRTSKGEEGQEQKQKKSGTTARTPASSETREHEVDDEPGSTPTVETPEEEKTRGVEGDDKAGSTPAAATQKEEKVEERKTRKPAPSKPRKTEKTQEGLRGDESGSSATGGQPYRETHKEKGGHTPEHGENPAASPKPSQARGNEKGRAKPREEKKKTTSSKKGQTSVEGEKRHQEAQGKDKSPLSGETHDAAATEAAGDEKLAASDGQHQTVKDEKGSAPQQEAAQKSQRWTRRHRESQKVEGQVPLSGAPSDEIQISDSDGSHRAEKDEKSSAAQQETAREVSREKKSRDSASDEKRNRESQDVEGQVPLSDKTHDAAAAEAAGDEKQIAASDGKHQTVKDEKGSAPQQEAAQEVTREKKSRTSASGETRHRGSKGAEGQVPLPDKTHDAAATEAAGEEKQTAASDGKHQTVKDEKGSAPQQEAAQKVKREKKSRTSASGEKRHRGSKGAEGQVSQPGTTHAPVTATTTAAANAAGGEIQLPPSESRQQAANEENKAHQEKTQEVERRKKSRASAASKQRQSVDSQVPRSGTTHSAATAAAGDEIQTPRPLVDSEHQATKNERHPVPVQDKTSKGERGKKSRKETHEAAAGDESGSIRSDRQQEAKKSVESAIPTSADERKKLDESEGSRASAPSEPHEEGVREDDAQVIANADRARLRSTSASSRRLSEAVSHEPKPHGEWAHLKWYCDKEKVPAKTDLCFYGIQRSAAGQLGYVFRSKEDTVPFKVGPFGTVTHVSDELRAFFKATRKESVEVGWILREIKINRKDYHYAYAEAFPFNLTKYPKSNFYFSKPVEKRWLNYYFLAIGYSVPYWLMSPAMVLRTSNLLNSKTPPSTWMCDVLAVLTPLIALSLTVGGFFDLECFPKTHRVGMYLFYIFVCIQMVLHMVASAVTKEFCAAFVLLILCSMLFTSLTCLILSSRYKNLWDHRTYFQLLFGLAVVLHMLLCSCVLRRQPQRLKPREFMSHLESQMEMADASEFVEVLAAK